MLVNSFMEVKKRRIVMAEVKPNGRLQAPPEFISVISSNHCARIRISDIEIIEQEGRRLHVVTPERDYSFYGSLNSIVTSLVDRAFYRTLQSMVINFDHVKDITGGSVNFVSGQSIILGRNAINKTKRAFKKYLMKYPPYSLWDPYQIMPMCVFESSEIDKDESSKSFDENT